ncbi:hypothetical protein NIES25_17420 [Nostoc linckia NIES-25]|nr:hypothetical protein NIES25_17420 [Nostoc linckia NIES-25]
MMHKSTMVEVIIQSSQLLFIFLLDFLFLCDTNSNNVCDTSIIRKGTTLLCPYPFVALFFQIGMSFNPGIIFNKNKEAYTIDLTHKLSIAESNKYRNFYKTLILLSALFPFFSSLKKCVCTTRFFTNF